MSAALAIADHQPRGVLVDMAERYGMFPAAFEATVRATCMPSSKGGVIQATKEEFAAFLLVAKEYRLNPLTREIYAFPRKGGGIVPIVSVDGWLSLVNSHPACDGFDLSFDHDQKGSLVSCTCSIYRKDRQRPTVVTEFLAECIRETDAWRMRHRMLRHKAMIQAARYAFGFSGIYDEDEGAIIAEAREITRSAPPPAPALPPAGPAKIEHQKAEPASGETTGKAQDAGEAPASPSREAEPASDPIQDAILDPAPTKDELLAELVARLGFARSAEEVEEAYVDFDAEAELEPFPGGVEAARAAKEAALARFEPAEPADLFAVPASFADADAFASWIRAAIAAATEADRDRLVAAWNDSKEQRAQVVMKRSLRVALQGEVGAKLAEFGPRSEAEAAETRQEAGEGAAPVIDIDAPATSWPEFAAQAAHALEALGGGRAWEWWQKNAPLISGFDPQPTEEEKRASKMAIVKARNLEDYARENG